MKNRALQDVKGKDVSPNNNLPTSETTNHRTDDYMWKIIKLSVFFALLCTQRKVEWKKKTPQFEKWSTTSTYVTHFQAAKS